MQISASLAWWMIGAVVGLLSFANSCAPLVPGTARAEPSAAATPDSAAFRLVLAGMGQQEQVRVDPRPVSTAVGRADWSGRNPPLDTPDGEILQRRRAIMAELGVSQGDIVAMGECIFTSGVPGPDGTPVPARCMALFDQTTVSVSLPEQEGRRRSLYRVRVLEIATYGYIVVEHHLRPPGREGGAWRIIRTDTIDSLIS